jgi:hypothetical protein
MAKYDRCEICDYTEADGSPLLGVNPREQGKVRQTGVGEYLCDYCVSTVGQCLNELEKGEDED